MHRAVFLDRDRTINEFQHMGSPDDPDSWNYILSWEQFEFMPGAIEGLKHLSEIDGLRLIVVSNQSCVGRGLISDDDCAAIFEKMGDELYDMHGVMIDGYYFCPHDPDDKCSCRKPKPGLFYHAAYMHDICLAKSWSVGDRFTDVQASMRAGIRRDRIVLVGDRPAFEYPAMTAGVLRAANLLGAAEYVISTST